VGEADGRRDVTRARHSLQILVDAIASAQACGQVQRRYMNLKTGRASLVDVVETDPIAEIKEVGEPPLI
jgi:hypothetical protein